MTNPLAARTKCPTSETGSDWLLCSDPAHGVPGARSAASRVTAPLSVLAVTDDPQRVAVLERALADTGPRCEITLVDPGDFRGFAADAVVAGEILRRLDHAADDAEARHRLKAMRGQEHQLLSGVAIAQHGEIVWRHQTVSRLWMRDFSDDYLDAYLRRSGEQALSSVGCYQLEHEGVQLFSRIDGDYFAILGLPLLEVLSALREMGALAR